MKDLSKKVSLYLALLGGGVINGQTTSFAYTGSMQTYTVPPGVLSINVDVIGAKGGNNGTYVGGKGGRVQSNATVTPGEVLQIYVGGSGVTSSGATASGGFNGGGNIVHHVGNGVAGTGGGGSDIRRSPYTINDRIVVAGGGGGGAYQTVGGDGGGLTAQNGVPYPTFPTSGGGGGTQSSGGVVGASASYCSGFSSAGALYQGGTGDGDGAGGGGGGGGYYGGGGGCFGGGGGGSSYTSAGMTSVVHTQGYQNGNGAIEITVLYAVSISQTSSISCNGLSTAALSASVISGVGPFTYSWSPSGGTSATATGLAAGIYTCTVISATSGTTTGTYTVMQPSVLSANTSSQTNVSCFGLSNGSALITASGGTSPYTYTWSAGAGNTANATGLAAGAYTVSVKDVNNCTTSANLTITQPASFAVNALTTSSVVCSGGSITLSGSGASSYAWSGGVTNGVAFVPSATTNYTVTGTVGVCSATAAVNVVVNTTPTLAVSNGTICSGNSFTFVPSGASTYTYSGGSAIVSPVITTVYTISGTSAQNCVSAPKTVTVTVNATPTLVVNSATVCNGNSATLSASGASSYTWNTLATTSSISASPAITTVYSFTGTTNGCSAIKTTTISVNANPTVSVANGTICSGQSFVFVPSGASTYTYSSGTATVSPLSTNVYTISGTSSLGCVSVSGTTVSVAVNITPTLSLSNGTICSGASFTITPGGAATYTVSGGSFVVSPVSTSVYTVSGTSSQNCSSAPNSMTLTVNTTPTVSVNSGSICNGDSFTIVPNGASTYTISGGSAVVNPVTSSAYSVSGTSSEGCVSGFAAVSNVTVYALPVVLVNDTVICSGQSVTLSPVGAATYTFSSGSAVVNPLVTSSYTVTGTSAEGCVSNPSSVVSISVNATPSVSVNGGTICAGQSFTLVPTGAVTYSYSGGNAVVNPVLTTNYVVTGASAEGCVSDSAMTTVVVNALPSLTLNADVSVLCLNDASVNLNGVPAGGIYSGTNVSGTLFAPSTVGVFTPVYSYTDGVTGCTNSVSTSVTVDECTGVSVNSPKTSVIKIYPNPGNGQFSIETTTSDEKIIIVSDVTGRIVLTTKSNELVTGITLTNVTNGIYYVSIQSGSSKQIIKLIKQ